MKNIYLYDEPQCDTSEIFLNLEICIEYCIIQGWILETKSCGGCGVGTRLLKISKYLNKVAYKCYNCKKEMNILENLRIKCPKISLCNYFRAIYKFLENVTEKDILRNLRISKKVLQKIKKNIYTYIIESNKMNSNIMIGGKNIKVQIDETAICHGKLVTTPSRMSDDSQGVTWLVGIIEERTGKFYYEIVKDRKVETIKEIIKKYVKEESEIITDGYPSYPAAILANNCTHRIVNHSKGFKNEEGFHTNNIENLWSLLKYEIKKRRGVVKSNLLIFLEEFKFRYNCLRLKTNEELKNVFIDIAEFLFKATEQN